MHAIPRRHPAIPLGLIALALAVYAVAVIVSGRLSQLERADWMALAVMIDLVLLAPAAYFLLMIRRWGASPVSLVPVIVLSVYAASRILPEAHRGSVQALEWLVIPVELGLLGWIAWRASRAVRRSRLEVDADPLERLSIAAFDLTRSERVAAILATELGLFYYALGAWRSLSHVPERSTAITLHRRSGHGGIVFGFVMLLAIEGFPVHLVVHTWNPLVAWLFTLSTVYAALWLIADYRATVLRPVLIEDTRVRIRAGLRCVLDIPRSNIAAISTTPPDHGRANMKLMLMSAPTRWITLHEPMRASGPYGIRSTVRSIGLSPDQADEFDRLLAVPTP